MSHMKARKLVIPEIQRIQQPQSYQETKATTSISLLTMDVMPPVGRIIEKYLKDFHRKVPDDDRVERPRIINSLQTNNGRL